MLTSPLRMNPNFLIIGTLKGGTTSLFTYLHEHPEIEMSRDKEPNYFSKNYWRGSNFYRSFFPLKSKGKITGEASPYYLYHPLVPARVKNYFSKIKLIVLLRDPVNRAFSHYQMLKNVDVAENFNHAIELENERVKPEFEKLIANPYRVRASHQAYSYISTGMYYEQVSRWLEYFDKDEILFLKSEDLFENPQKELKRIYNYLGIEEIIPDNMEAQNQREYTGLSADDYNKYKQLFKDDSEKLKALLGDNFSW